MVVNDGTNASWGSDVVLLVESTANLFPFVESIKTNYIVPSLEYFNGAPADDRDFGHDSISNCSYTLLTFSAADSAPDPACVTVTPPTSSIGKVLTAFDKLLFAGGAAEQCSHITEGLATALQVFEDLTAFKGISKENSSHCILVCNSPPYQIPVLETMGFLGQSLEQVAAAMQERNITLSIICPRKIPQLCKLFEKAGGDLMGTLGKNYAKDKRHLILPNGFTLSERPVTPPPESRLAPASPRSPANIQKRAQPVSNSPPREAKIFKQPGSVPSPQQGVPMPSVAAAAVQRNQAPTPPHVGINQPNNPNMNLRQFNADVRSPGGGRMSWNNPSPPVSTPSPTGNMSLLQSQLSTAPMRSQNPGQFQQNPMFRPRMNAPGGVPNQNQGQGSPGMVYNNQQQQQMANNPNQIGPAQNMQGPNQMGAQPNMGQQVNKAQPNMGGPNINQQQGMGQQPQQQQNMNPQGMNQHQMQQGGNMMNPNMGANQGNPMGGPNANMMRVNQGNMSGPGGPIGAPQQQGMGRRSEPIWRGEVEYLDRSSTPPQKATPYRLQCVVSFQMDQEVNTATWPEKMQLQLLPKPLLMNVIPNVKNAARCVHFNFPPPSDGTNDQALANLCRLMTSSSHGFIHLNPPCDLKVILVFYMADKNTFMGLIAHDQDYLLNAIIQVFEIHKKQKMMGHPGSNQVGPQGAIGPPHQGPMGAMGGQGNMTNPQQRPMMQQGPMGGGQMNQMGMNQGPPNQMAQRMSMQGGQQGNINHQGPNHANVPMNNMNMGGSQQIMPGGQQGMMQQQGPGAQPSGSAADFAAFEAERKQNLLKIQQLQQTLEAAQQKELQYIQQQTMPGQGGQVGMMPQQGGPRPMGPGPQMRGMAPQGSAQNPQLRHLLQQQAQMRAQMMGGPGQGPPQGGPGQPQQIYSQQQQQQQQQQNQQYLQNYNQQF